MTPINSSFISNRADFKLIADIVEPGSRVLDIGCSDGSLLDLLEKQKNVDGKGIEISPEGVNASVRRGLSVIQGDANTDPIAQASKNPLPT